MKPPKSPEVITAAIWDILITADGKDPQSRRESVEGLHRIAVDALQALAVMQDIAPKETIDLCRESTLWPQLISPMNDSEAKRRLAVIRTHLGKDTGFDGTATKLPGSNAFRAVQWYHVLECERRNHLWGNLSDYAKAQYASTAKDGQTPEECFAEFKSVNYPEWEKKTVIDPLWEKEPALIREDIRWVYAAGLLEPLTKKNAAEWAEAATLYLESLSPEGNLTRCPVDFSIAIDPQLEAVNPEASKADFRHSLKRKLRHGFEAIAWNA